MKESDDMRWPNACKYSDGCSVCSHEECPVRSIYNKLKPAWVSSWLNAILEDQDENQFRNEKELAEALELHESDNEFYQAHPMPDHMRLANSLGLGDE